MESVYNDTSNVWANHCLLSLYLYHWVNVYFFNYCKVNFHHIYYYLMSLYVICFLLLFNHWDFVFYFTVWALLRYSYFFFNICCHHFFGLGFYVILIYLTVLGLSHSMQHLCWVMRDLGSVIVALCLPRHMEDLSCLIRDWTRLPCIARQVLSHWTTREVLYVLV